MAELPKLPPHQIKWIFDAAHEHFAEKLAEQEAAIIRHKHFLAAGSFFYYTKIMEGAQSREEAIERAQNWINEYGKVMQVIAHCRKAAGEASAVESAEGIAEYLRGKKTKPAGKKVAKK